MKAEKIRLAIIGMGRMGITHYSIINSREDVEMVAVVDTSKLVLNMIKKYLKNLRVYNDYNNLLKDGDVDGVLVCTPPHLNYDIITKCAAKGIHVFVEKPFVTDLGMGKKLQAIYEKNGLVNQVGYVNRYNDVFLKTKELVQSGILGEIYRFSSEMFSCTISQPDKGAGWRASRESGGGAVFEMAAHAIDLVNFIFGKPKDVKGSMRNKVYSKSVEDVVSTTFLFDDDLIGMLYVNWCDHSYRKPTNKLEVIGKNGRLLADQHSLKLYLNRENSNHDYRQGWNTIYITDIFKPVEFYVRGNEFTRQLYHFADSIQNGTKADCDFNEGNKALDIIHSIFKDYEA